MLTPDLYICVTQAARNNWSLSCGNLFIFRSHTLYRPILDRHVFGRLEIAVKVSKKVLIEPSEMIMSCIMDIYGHQTVIIEVDDYRMVRGRRFQGPVRNISETTQNLRRKPLYFLYFG